MTAPKSPRDWHVLVSTRKKKNPFGARALRELVAAILNQKPYARVPRGYTEVSILFTGDAEIHRLNREFRGKDKPTDVLSFAEMDSQTKEAPSPSLGDLVISLDTAKRQARVFGVTLKQEVLRLLIHGLLHLAGYDHENVSPAKAQRMRRAERRIFAGFKGKIT